MSFEMDDIDAGYGDWPTCLHTCAACFDLFEHYALSAFYARSPRDCHADYPELLCRSCQIDEEAGG